MNSTIVQSIDYQGLLLMGGFLGLLVLFAFGMRKQQRRIQSGREVARSTAIIQNNLIGIQLRFRVDHPGKWYRLCADFEYVSEDNEGIARPKIRILHPFKLGLRDEEEKILVEDAQSFHNFLGFAGTQRKRQTSYILVGHSSSFSQGEGVPLLEFVPTRPGKFNVEFSMPAVEIIDEGTLRYESSISQFSLSIKEDVLPMRARAYPHKKIDFRIQ